MTEMVMIHPDEGVAVDGADALPRDPLLDRAFLHAALLRVPDEGADGTTGTAVGPDRSYRVLERTQDYEVWAIHWPCGGALELHDHGGSSGAVVVVHGTLTEQFVADAVRLETRTLRGGGQVSFGAGHVHDLHNHGHVPALSVHVYAPPLEAMTFFDLAEEGLIPTRRSDPSDPAWEAPLVP